MVGEDPISEESLARALIKVDQALDSEGNGFPFLTDHGKWKRTMEGSWSDGFWMGLLWLAYSVTHESKFEVAARELLKRLEPRIKASNADFDLGFLFYPSAAIGHEITGDHGLRDIALGAADRMIQFMHSKVGVIFVSIQTVTVSTESPLKAVSWTLWPISNFYGGRIVKRRTPIMSTSQNGTRGILLNSS